MSAHVNLSLVLWFVAYSLTLLVWGSLSDRFGRRPIVITGLTLFAISSALCAVSQTVGQLIAARILQGVAAAGGSSMVMAIARDRFEGTERQRTLAWIGVILGLAPMIAPSIGAAILQHANWRWVFVVQAALAGATLALTLAVYQETLLTLDPSGIGGVVQRFVRLAKSGDYMLANGSTGLLSAPFLGFIGFSAIAYIVHFGMSEERFALMFGANALCVIAGSAACSRLIGRHSEYVLLPMTFAGCLCGGMVLLIAGGSAWIVFSLGMALFSYFFGMSRPLVNHLVLEQVDRDIGAAASAIVCYQFLCGATGMALATQEWTRPFLAFGVLAVACPLATLLLWPFLLRRSQEDSSVK